MKLELPCPRCGRPVHLAGKWIPTRPPHRYGWCECGAHYVVLKTEVLKEIDELSFLGAYELQVVLKQVRAVLDALQRLEAQLVARQACFAEPAAFHCYAQDPLRSAGLALRRALRAAQEKARRWNGLVQAAGSAKERG